MLIGTSCFFAPGWGLLVGPLPCGDLCLPVPCCVCVILIKQVTEPLCASVSSSSYCEH